MKHIRLGFIVCALWIWLSSPAQLLFAETPAADDAKTVIALFKEQNSKLSGDLRRIQREIAALRADLDKPGIKEVFSGIGYILGLFGTAALVASRRKPIR